MKHGWLFLFMTEDGTGCPVIVLGRRRRKAMSWAVCGLREKGIKGRLRLEYAFKKSRKGRGMLPAQALKSGRAMRAVRLRVSRAV